MNSVSPNLKIEKTNVYLNFQKYLPILTLKPSPSEYQLSAVLVSKYLPNPSHIDRKQHKVIFKQSLSGLKSEYPSPRLG